MGTNYSELARNGLVGILPSKELFKLFFSSHPQGHCLGLVLLIPNKRLTGPLPPAPAFSTSTPSPSHLVRAERPRRGSRSWVKEARSAGSGRLASSCPCGLGGVFPSLGFSFFKCRVDYNLHLSVALPGSRSGRNRRNYLLTRPSTLHVLAQSSHSQGWAAVPITTLPILQHRN